MGIQKRAVIIGAVVALAALNVRVQTAAASAPSASAPDKAAKKATRKADHTLEKAVRKALAKDKAVDMTRLNVRVRNGAVTLLGSVAEEGQIAAATQAARGVAGVTSVNNALTIKAVGQ